MAPSTTPVFDDMTLDHVMFYVTDIAAKTDWYAANFGFSVYAATGTSGRFRAAGLGGNRIRLVLAEALDPGHPAAGYVERHGDGVADIALRVTDATAAFDEAVRRGARPVAAPVKHAGVVLASVGGFGDVVHTFVQRSPGGDDRVLPWLPPPAGGEAGNGLGEVDHFAVCVEPGDLDATVDFYLKVLDFELIFTEHIAVGSQGMTTKVVQSRSGDVTFTLIEPDVLKVAGHIDEFLDNHGGPGVQHMAFTAGNIVTAVDSIGGRGVEFLSTPPTYYKLLAERLDPGRYSIQQLRRFNILVDEDHDGQLFQIFTKSVHERRTFFLELIERRGARSFGSGNITSLYRAVELQRAKEREAAA